MHMVMSDLFQISKVCFSVCFKTPSQYLDTMLGHFLKKT